MTEFASQRNPLSKQPGFDPRLCYGDIVLSFVYHPYDEPQEEVPAEGEEEKEELTEPSFEEGRVRRDVDVVIYELKRPHDWMRTHFDQERLCDSCRNNVSEPFKTVCSVWATLDV